MLATAALTAPQRADGASHAADSEEAHTRHRVSTPNFEVHFSVPPRVGHTYAALCERAFRNFRRKFHLDDDVVVWEGKCHVYLFASQDEFTRFATEVHHSHAAAEAGGYTRINKQEPDIVLYLNGNDHTTLKQVLVHEMTHVFLQLFGNHEAEIQMWLHEGFAQYFEFQVNPRHSRLKDSRARVKRLVRGGQTVPLAKFWEATFSAKNLDAYAQAWSLVEFMVRKGSAKRAGQFILMIKEGHSQEEALRETFGCSLDRVELAWKQYVLSAY